VVGFTGLDAKLPVASNVLRIPGQVIDVGQRRGIRLQFRQKPVERPRGPFDFDQDIAGAVLDEAAQFKSRCQAVDERAKANALDDSLYCYRTAFHDEPPQGPADCPINSNDPKPEHNSLLDQADNLDQPGQQPCSKLRPGCSPFGLCQTISEASLEDSATDRFARRDLNS
jgi:hypothetical protein